MQQQHMDMNSPSRGDAAALQEIVYELKRENSLLAAKYHEDLGGLRRQMQQERDETARAVQDTARVVAQLDAEKQSYAGIHTKSQKDLAEVLGHADNLSQAVESLELELTTVKTERDGLEQRNVQLSKATEWTVSQGSSVASAVHGFRCAREVPPRPAPPRPGPWRSADRGARGLVHWLHTAPTSSALVN
jgi:chromosome segregation ATPase